MNNNTDPIQSSSQPSPPSPPNEGKESTWLGRRISEIKEVGTLIYILFETVIKGLVWSLSTICYGALSFIVGSDADSNDESSSSWSLSFSNSYPDHSYLTFEPDTNYGTYEMEVVSHPVLRPGLPNNRSDCFMNSVNQCLKFVHAKVLEHPQYQDEAERFLIKNREEALPDLTRISHKILDEGGRDVAPDSLTMGREHCPRDKARSIGGEDGVTDRSDSPRVCEKYGLSFDQQLLQAIKISRQFAAQLENISQSEYEIKEKEKQYQEIKKELISELIQIEPLTENQKEVSLLVRNIFQQLNEKENESLLREMNKKLRKVLPQINPEIYEDRFSDAVEYFSVVKEALQWPEYTFIERHTIENNAPYIEKVKHCHLPARFPKEKSEDPLHLTPLALSQIELRAKAKINGIEIPEDALDRQQILLPNPFDENQAIDYKKIPPFIPIQLTRFYRGESISYSYKIFNEVDFDTFMEIAIDGSEKKVRYKLNSVVLHYGETTDALHYVAYCFEKVDQQDKFVLYDDNTKVGVCEDQEAAKKDIRKYGYLFFYVFDSII